MANKKREQIGGDTYPVRACMYRNNCPCWAALISGIHRMLIPTKTITKILHKQISMIRFLQLKCRNTFMNTEDRSYKNYDKQQT